MFHPEFVERLAAVRRGVLTAAAGHPSATRPRRAWSVTQVIDRAAGADFAPILLARAPRAAFIGLQVSCGRDVLGGLSGSGLRYTVGQRTRNVTLTIATGMAAIALLTLS